MFPVLLECQDFLIAPVHFCLDLGDFMVLLAKLGHMRYAFLHQLLATSFLAQATRDSSWFADTTYVAPRKLHHFGHDSVISCVFFVRDLLHKLAFLAAAEIAILHLLQLSLHVLANDGSQSFHD